MFVESNLDPLVSIIILNYNGSKYLRKLLDSILSDTPPFRFELIIIDNGSKDNSLEIIKDYYKNVTQSSICKVLINKTNLGFGKAMNQGLKLARGKYVAFLNCDLYVESGWLKRVIEVFHQKPRVAIVQPLICDYDNPLRIQSTGLYCDWVCNFKGADQKAQETQAILAPFGAAFIAKRDIFQRIGGFDPDYFLYGEEIDIGLRTWMTGFMVMLTSKAKVFHKGGGVTPKQILKGYTYCYNARRNQLQTIIKTFSWKMLPYVLISLTVINLLRIMNALRFRNYHIIFGIINAYLYIVKNLRKLLKKRSAFQRIKKVNEATLKKVGLLRPFLQL